MTQGRQSAKFHPTGNEGSIGDWARQRGIPVTRTRLYLDEHLPDTGQFEFLCIMGGPMNIYEEDRYTFLTTEKQFLRSCLDAGKKILGICLGAQL
ncbi:MAG: hypothetical protein EHM28_04485 [Spirochaetaceae bacterium]|nr:MAG: hypothetical protein EHM28_04485 [Spirochaetaceae bacterium]